MRLVFDRIKRFRLNKFRVPKKNQDKELAIEANYQTLSLFFFLVLQEMRKISMKDYLKHKVG